MRANELMLWLSARREGSWQQFRAAVQELYSGDGDNSTSRMNTQDDGEFPLYQRLRLDLECLAHAEFFAGGCEDGWRVVPPTLAVHPMPDGVRAVFCGARSPELLERVVSSARNVRYETLNPSDVPEVLRVVASDLTALEGIARQAGLHFQPDAPLAILSHLRPCDPPSRSQKQSEFPVGADWSIHELDASGLKWRTTDRHRTQTAHRGLFRFTHRFHRAAYFLRWAESTFELPRAVALYVLLKRNRHDLLRYDASTQTLRLPAICRPPRLLERALVLCSGLPPAYDAATLTYADVPPEIARFAAELLRQPLR